MFLKLVLRISLLSLFYLIVISGSYGQNTVRHFLVAAYCDNEDEIAHALETYESNTPFDIVQTKNSIQFSIIEACCLQFHGETGRSEEGIELLYDILESDEICECFCKYTLTYSFRNPVLPAKLIYINEELYNTEK